MTQIAHFGEPSAQQPVIPLDAQTPSLAHYSGLLGNQSAQTPRRTLEFEEDKLWLWTILNRQVGTSRPDSKFAILKRRTFTPEGREQRIAASLAALEAPQPTVLTREQWKEIVEEVEDEDDED